MPGQSCIGNGIQADHIQPYTLLSRIDQKLTGFPGQDRICPEIGLTPPPPAPAGEKKKKVRLLC